MFSLIVLFVAGPAFAVTVPDLYEASVPVTSNRDAAFVDALRTVVIRVSGRADAAARLGGALNNPRQYAQRFGFTSDNILQVAFDDVSVDRLLTEAGLPVWGRERPATLVLLNVTTAGGSSYWIDASASSAEREAIARAARVRGVPIVWPDMTTQDRTQINADAAATGGDTAALLQTASRYNANAALLGTARSDGAGGLSVRWTLASADGTANSSGSLEDGINLAADTFARVYSASGTTVDNLTVEVSGINTLGAYATTLNYLEGLTVVRGVAVDQVLGDTLRFRVAVRGDAATLRRALALDGRLVPATALDTQPQSAEGLRFRYQP
ncbi:DUF2066 domain-containing protein [Povalibacter sp.]|uniref:DUF2066 domain-containing protein n=1 Tax=Povalibacter sp. TaxID=1962978 RepID=UPI002D1F9BD1|nr:DUF2066 domain-containing protein [Povalibacter sp.]